MYGIKVILSTAAICSVVAAILFVWNRDAIISNIGEFFYKTYTILFMLSAIVLTKEATSITTKQDYE
jgi:high-affinity Fe2+/Pb2+ permease